MAAFDELAHLPIEEGQQQRADMAAVDIGVGHDDDLVVARLVDVEILGPDAGAQGGDQGADLGRGQHLVEARPLDIKDLAAQRQDRLKGAVAPLLGRAAGRIALDDEQFGRGRVALLAIGQLAGQGGDVERALAPRQLAGLARGLARGRRLDHLADDLAASAGCSSNHWPSFSAHDGLDHRADFRGDQLVLGLRREFGIGHLDRQHAGQAFAHVVAGQRHFFSFGDAANRWRSC